jgi:hypothetical protein
MPLPADILRRAAATVGEPEDLRTRRRTMFMPAYGMIRLLATPDGFAELRWAGEGLSRRFARRGPRWLAGKARHGRASSEQRRLDDRDLDDLATGRGSAPAVAPARRGAGTRLSAGATA